MSKQNLRGFTLVELLVTITILAILATISISIFFNLQKNSRDTKRKSDLATIQSALEQYHADQGFYPNIINPPDGDPDYNPYYIKPKTPPLTLTSSVGNPTPPADIKTYLNVLPTNPITTLNDYTYLPFLNNAACIAPNTCTSYCLYTNMEKSTNSNRSQVPTYCKTFGSLTNLIGTDVSPGTFNYAVAAP